MLNFKNNKFTILLYLIPAFCLYLGLELFPAFLSILLSFFKWRGIGGSQFHFYGLKNYIEIFNDSVFWLSTKNLGYFLLLSLVTQLPVALLFAYLISLNLKGNRFFKVTFFIPVVLSVTAISLMWKMILAGNYGLLNKFLETIGLGNYARAWLTDPSTSFTSIVLVNSWIQSGFFIVILLAGIVSIPEEIFEALKIDGAGEIKVFFRIIIPLIWEIIGICVVLILTTTIKTFDLIYVLTSGSFGPADMNQVPVGYMYYTSFIGDNFGNGSAIATLVTVAGVVLSSIVYLKGFQEKTA